MTDKLSYKRRKVRNSLVEKVTSNSEQNNLWLQTETGKFGKIILRLGEFFYFISPIITKSRRETTKKINIGKKREPRINAGNSDFSI
jgi:hypothetical protein